LQTGWPTRSIARAADVTLKERRPLLLCVRETPFNRIHLRNMTLAAEAGAVIFPCDPVPFTTTPSIRRRWRASSSFRVLAHIGSAAAGSLCVEGGRVASQHRSSSLLREHISKDGSDFDLTFPPFSLDTANNVELKGIRNCGHGHVHVYVLRTCPCGS
jgi:hypothetical protein